MTDARKLPQSQSGIKSPNSLRAFQIITGLLTLALAGMVMVFPGIAVYLIAVWLSVSLLFAGIGNVVIGAGASFLSKGQRAVSIGVGAAAIITSTVILAYPASAIVTMSLLLSVGLLFLGAGYIARGISEKRTPGWARAMLLVVGIITVGLAIPIVIFPALGVPVLLIMAAAALIINGASYIAAGITGEPFVRGVYRGPNGSAKKPSDTEAA